MKYCNQCKTNKDITDFPKNKSKPDGHASGCKSCINTKAKTPKAKAAARKRQAKLPSRTEYYHKHYLANKEEHAIKSKQYKLDHPEVNRLSAVNQRVKRLKRNTNWSDSNINKKEIKALYDEAERLTKLTGIPHQVDHVIPLQGKCISGLHHYTNLQIITGEENRKKSNKFLIQDSAARLDSVSVMNHE